MRTVLNFKIVGRARIDGAFDFTKRRLRDFCGPFLCSIVNTTSLVCELFSGIALEADFAELKSLKPMLT